MPGIPTTGQHLLEISAECIPNGVNTQDGDYIFILEKSKSQKVCFTITNIDITPIKFDGYTLKSKVNQLVEASHDDRNNLGCGGTFEMLGPLGEYQVYIQLKSKDFTGCGSAHVRVRFNFNANGTPVNLVRVITYDVIASEHEKLYNSLMTADPNEQDYDWSGLDGENDGHLTIIWLDRDYSLPSVLVKTLVLLTYRRPHQYGVLGHWPVINIRIHLDLKLYWMNYSDYFGHLLYFEELQYERDLKAYTVYKRRIHRDSSEDRYKLKVPGLLEKRPSLMIGDRIFATPLFDGNKYKYEGGVVSISQSTVYLIFNPKFSDEVDDMIDRVDFKVEFRFRRENLRLMHRACSLAVGDCNLERSLFPAGRFRRAQLSVQMKFYDKRVELNKEQSTAVKHIVEGTSRPAPYIIYGPPGTGKTVTLVEAIKQVYSKNNTYILVCAPANDAADLIATRLLDDVPSADILRFNAASRSYSTFTTQIRSIAESYVITEHTAGLDKQDIMRKRIVITTLTTSGRLVSAEMTSHYTHIFIDEAGFATEPETLIALGLLNIHSQPCGQLVLAGDPKQLGPIIRSTIAEHYGLGNSLLKRLMDDPKGPYTPDRNNKYNPNYVTKLVNSFRSHPDILVVPNANFYDNELVPKADKTEREKFCTWKHLPDLAKKNRFPLIFHAVQGREAKERCSPSWMNLIEVLQVKEYVEKLLLRTGSVGSIKPEQIGIISPYHRQVIKIIKALREAFGHHKDIDLKKIKVGSVEKFQGDERDVIIISTVRSTNHKCEEDSARSGLGFLVNEKRFNVAITRAKALLIVIGNPLTLCKDRNWRSLIEQIIGSGGYIGVPKKKDLLVEMEGIPVNSTAPQTPLYNPGSATQPSEFLQMVDPELIPGNTG